MTRLWSILLVFLALACRADLFVFEGDSITRGGYGGGVTDYYLSEKCATLPFFSGMTITNVARGGFSMFGDATHSGSITNQLFTNITTRTTSVGEAKYLWVMIGVNDYHLDLLWSNELTGALGTNVFQQWLTNYYSTARTNGYRIVGSTIVIPSNSTPAFSNVFLEVNTQIRAKTNFMDAFVDSDLIISTYKPSHTGVHLDPDDFDVLATNINSILEDRYIRYVDNEAVGTKTGKSWANAWPNLDFLERDTNAVKAGQTVYLAGRHYTNTVPIALEHGTDPWHWVRYYATGDVAHIYTLLKVRHFTEINGGKNQDYHTNLVSVYDVPLITNNYSIWMHRETNWWDGGADANIFLSDDGVTGIIKWVRLSGWTNVYGTEITGDTNWPVSDSGNNIRGSVYPSNTVEIAYIWCDISSGHGSSGVFNLSTLHEERPFGAVNIHHCLVENHNSDLFGGEGGFDFHHNLIRHRDPVAAGGCNDAFVLVGDTHNIRIYNNIFEPLQNTQLYLWGSVADIHDFYFYGNLYTIVPPAYQKTPGDGGGPGVMQQDTELGMYYYRSNVVFANNTWVASTNGGIGRMISWITKNNLAAGFTADDYSVTIKNNLFVQIDTVPIVTKVDCLNFHPGTTGGTNNLGYGYAYGTNAIIIDHNYFDMYCAGNLQPLISWGPTDTLINLSNATDIAALQGTVGNVSATNASLLVDAWNYDYRPASTNVNIGEDLSSMTNLMPGLTVDIYGRTRGLSGAWSAGAIEFTNTGLLCWLTFEDDFPTLGYSDDMSGNGARMQRFGWGASTTNYPTVTNGYNSTQAAHFLPYLDSHPWTNSYIIGQYGVITNLGALHNLTQATFAVWIKYDLIDPDDRGTYQQAGILSAGYGRSGNWTWTRSYAGTYGNPTFMVQTNTSGDESTMWKLAWPEVATFWWFTNNSWQHLAISVDCSDSQNLQAVLYTNGISFSTNTLSLSSTGAVPRLTVHMPSLVTNLAWIGLGVRTHNGTWPLEDSDSQPNHGWLNGALDDVRIYNRILTAAEVASIAGATIAGGEEPPAPPAATSKSATATRLNATTIRGM